MGLRGPDWEQNKAAVLVGPSSHVSSRCAASMSSMLFVCLSLNPGWCERCSQVDDRRPLVPHRVRLPPGS